MRCTRNGARQIVAQGCQYLMVVKANQPELHNALTEWFAQPAWDGEQAEQVTTFSKGHGRHEWRTLERRAVVQLPWDWPGVQQVMRRHTVADLIAPGRRRQEVCYGLTSLSWQQASAAWRHFGANCRRALRFIGLLC
jgi:hypothetical protein